jgi:hypothetical protein
MSSFGWQSATARSKSVLAVPGTDTTIEAKAAPRNLLYVEVTHAGRRLLVTIDYACTVIGVNYLGGEPGTDHVMAVLTRDAAERAERDDPGLPEETPEQTAEFRRSVNATLSARAGV